MAGIAELPPLEGHNPTAMFMHLVVSQSLLRHMKPVFDHFIERKIGLHSPARFAAAIGIGEGTVVVSPVITFEPGWLDEKLEELEPPEGKTPMAMLNNALDTFPQAEPFRDVFGIYEDRAKKYLIDQDFDRGYLAEAATLGFVRLSQVAIQAAAA